MIPGDLVQNEDVPRPDAGSGETMPTRTRGHRRRLALALLIPSVLFVGVALSMSLLTPALTNNDEAGHVQYAVYIESHGALPMIGIQNGDESHQPPLYYATLALWMKVTGIQHVTLTEPVSPATSADVHVLRLPGIAYGLVTVLAAFGCAWVLTRRLAFSSAVASTVGLWPKFDVVSGAVTNGTLTCTLCALALLALLLWLRADRRAALWAGVAGLMLGLAAITELTSLPIAGLLLLLIVAVSVSRRRWRDPLLAVALFAAVSGWWFVRNLAVYGDPLASAATRAYLSRAIPILVCPCPGWTLGTVLHQLVYSIWYDGGFNQWALPWRLSAAIGVLAVLCLGRGIWIVWRHHRTAGAGRLDLLTLLLTALGAVIALGEISTQTSQAEGRYLLIAASAWSLLLVAGTDRIRRLGERAGQVLIWCWPAGFAILDVYVFVRFVIPLS